MLIENVYKQSIGNFDILDQTISLNFFQKKKVKPTDNYADRQKFKKKQ